MEFWHLHFAAQICNSLKRTAKQKVRQIITLLLPPAQPNKPFCVITVDKHSNLLIYDNAPTNGLYTDSSCINNDAYGYAFFNYVKTQNSTGFAFTVSRPKLMKQIWSKAYAKLRICIKMEHEIQFSPYTRKTAG